MPPAALPAYQFLDQLGALPFVEALYLYGSRARHDHQTRSDIDLAIKLSPGHSPQDWLRVLDIIDKADTLLEIDCVNLDTVPANLAADIYQEGTLLYGKAGTKPGAA